MINRLLYVATATALKWGRPVSLACLPCVLYRERRR